MLRAELVLALALLFLSFPHPPSLAQTSLCFALGGTMYGHGCVSLPSSSSGPVVNLAAHVRDLTEPEALISHKTVLGLSPDGRLYCVASIVYDPVVEPFTHVLLKCIDRQLNLSLPSSSVLEALRLDTNEAATLRLGFLRSEGIFLALIHSPSLVVPSQTRFTLRYLPLTSSALPAPTTLVLNPPSTFPIKDPILADLLVLPSSNSSLALFNAFYNRVLFTSFADGSPPRVENSTLPPTWTVPQRLVVSTSQGHVLIVEASFIGLTLTGRLLSSSGTILVPPWNVALPSECLVMRLFLSSDESRAHVALSLPNSTLLLVTAPLNGETLPASVLLPSAPAPSEGLLLLVDLLLLPSSAPSLLVSLRCWGSLPSSLYCFVARLQEGAGGWRVEVPPIALPPHLGEARIDAGVNSDGTLVFFFLTHRNPLPALLLLRRLSLPSGVLSEPLLLPVKGTVHIWVGPGPLPLICCQATLPETGFDSLLCWDSALRLTASWDLPMARPPLELTFGPALPFELPPAPPTPSLVTPPSPNPSTLSCLGAVDPCILSGDFALSSPTNVTVTTFVVGHLHLSSSLIVMAPLTVRGNLILEEGASLSLLPPAELKVEGNFTLSPLSLLLVGPLYLPDSPPIKVSGCFHLAGRLDLALAQTFREDSLQIALWGCSDGGFASVSASSTDPCRPDLPPVLTAGSTLLTATLPHTSPCPLEGESGFIPGLSPAASWIVTLILPIIALLVVLALGILLHYYRRRLVRSGGNERYYALDEL